MRQLDKYDGWSNLAGDSSCHCGVRPEKCHILCYIQSEAKVTETIKGMEF
jgi:hypothetical protein